MNTAVVHARAKTRDGMFTEDDGSGGSCSSSWGMDELLGEDLSIRETARNATMVPTLPSTASPTVGTSWALARRALAARPRSAGAGRPASGPATAPSPGAGCLP
jgi:hypothetical protein